MKAFGFIGVFCFLSLVTYSQASDSLLVNLRNMDWPLVNFKNQWQAELLFNIGAGLTAFDNEGRKYSLDDFGETYTRFDYGFSLSYGFTDYLEFSMNIFGQNIASRKESQVLFSALGVQNVSYLYETQGLEDLQISARLKYPFTLEKYDIVVGAGIWLPLMGYGEQEPRHSTEAQTDFEQVTYSYLTAPGSGTAGVFFTGGGKYRWSDMAVEIMYTQGMPVGDGSTSQWLHQYQNNSFEYEENKYPTHFPSFIQSYAKIELQVNKFFSTYLGYSYEARFAGWKQIGTKKVATKDEISNRLLFGGNLIASTRIWYQQEFGYVVSGRNINQPILLRAKLIFNIF